MAPKDYVKRGRAPSKKEAPEKKSSPPWVGIIITAGLIGVFAYFLWSIKGGGENDSPSLTQKSAPEVVQPNNKPLPEKPQEQWEFIDTLENQQIEVEVPEGETELKTYQMQCGSFRQQQQAETMRAQLAMIGQEAKIKATEGKNGLWHRVVLGPYEGKRAAERDRHQIRKLGITTCQIWLWN